MRFEEVLEDYVIDDWSAYYVQFLRLKEQLTRVDPNEHKLKNKRQTSFHWNKAYVLSIKDTPDATNNNISPSHSSFEESDDRRESITQRLIIKPKTVEAKTWEVKLQKDIQKVELFFQNKKQEILDFYKYFVDSLEKIYRKDAFQEPHFFSELHEKSMVSAEQITLRYGNAKILSEIYTELLCLESYCIVNMLSINILLREYAHTYQPDEQPDFRALFQLDKYEFNKKENLSPLKDGILNYVADNITNGDKKAALDLLRKNKIIKMEDLAKIAFLLGIVCSTLIVLVVAAWIEFKSDQQRQEGAFFASFQIYRFAFCTLLSFWYMTISRYVLQLKHLNFNFVLDIRPSNMGKIQRLIQLMTYSTFVFQVGLLFDIFLSEITDYIRLILFLATVILLLWPFRSSLLKIKYAMFKLLAQCLGSPFTQVAFIHILMADCMTSFNKVILDIVNSFYWIYAKDWDNPSQPLQLNLPKAWTIFILALPYEIRFMQCLKRYYVTKLVFPNIYNAVKYGLSIATIILANLDITTTHPLLQTPFLVVGFTSFFYNNYWDNYNDWGLFRKWDPEKRFLRDGLNFKPKFYYTIMIVNFFLRLSWMGTLLSKTVIESIFEDQNLFVLVTEALEITRRFLWSIIRIEYELYSNFENLRDFMTVPSVYYLKDKRKRRLQAL